MAVIMERLKVAAPKVKPSHLRLAAAAKLHEQKIVVEEAAATLADVRQQVQGFERSLGVAFEADKNSDLLHCKT